MPDYNVDTAAALDYLFGQVFSSAAGHLVLDMAGMVPAVGELFDFANGVWYTIEGDGTSAAISFASTIPLVYATTVKNVGKVVKLANGTTVLVKFSKEATERLVDVLKRLDLDAAQLQKLSDDLTDKEFAEAIAENPELVGSWKLLDESGLEEVIRRSVDYLTVVDNYIKRKGISPDILKNELKGLESYQVEFLDGLKISNNNILELFPKIKMDDLPVSQDGSLMGRYVNGFLEVYGSAQVAGKWDYVVKVDGEILIGRKHSFMSQGLDVLAAGEVKFSNGKLVDINNLSGHYIPNPGETFNFLRLFKFNGVDISDATLSIYKGNGDFFNQVPPSAIKRVLYE